MEILFRKYFWTIQLAVLAIAAVLIGAGLTRFAASRAAALSVTVPPASAPSLDDGDANLVARSVPENAFPIDVAPVPVDLCAGVLCDDGEICNPATAQCEPDEAAMEDAEEDSVFDPNRPCTDTSLAIGLSGTMVSDTPSWSIAILHNPSTNKTEFARHGSKILNQAEVVRIQRNRVFIDRGGAIECLRPASVREAAQQRQQQASSDAAAAPEPAPTGRRGRTPQEEQAAEAPAASAADNIRQGVSRTGANSYSIQRSTLNEVLQDQDMLRDQAPRVQPHYRDGRPNGFRLNGLSSDSIFSAIGIRNGDVIHSVNGQVVDSPQRAMELYRSLMTSSRVEMTIERRGQQETLTYQIQ